MPNGARCRQPISTALPLIRAVLPGMQARDAARSSTCARSHPTSGARNIVAYATSKGALKMLTRALAVETAPYNVQVNGIAPGFFKTEMNAPLIANAEFSAWVGKRTPPGAGASRPRSRAPRCSWRRAPPTTSPDICSTSTAVQRGVLTRIGPH
jgi:gluconate 5-dehydrogenase